MTDDATIFDTLLGPHEARLAKGSALSIGNFDGVHLGHQAILEDLRARSDQLGVPAVVLTFEPHPVTVFRGRAPDEFRISTDAERERLLRAHGVDVVLTARFDRAFAGISADRFVRELLFGRIHARHVLVGYDFNFGRGRTGSTETLREIAAAAGVPVTVHQPVTFDGTPVSSTRVRRALAGGDLRQVSTLLQRPLSFSGTTEPGAGRGRRIGVPTLNLYPVDRLLPPSGVYATRLRLGERCWDAISNLGVRPSFDDDDRVSLETMVLTSFDGADHGAKIQVDLVAYLRPERRFETPEALRTQIEADTIDARRLLAE